MPANIGYHSDSEPTMRSEHEIGDFIGALRDTRLSFKARGMLAMVLSHATVCGPFGWGTLDFSGQVQQASRDWIIKQSEKDGKDAVQSALNELTDLGYREVTTERDSSGRVRTVAKWRDASQETNGL
jgi:hypothetical protein